MIEHFEYKKVAKCQIALDVHLPEDTHDRALPILLWFHGGGLLQGSRKYIEPHLLNNAKIGRYLLVAVDYRLAPQVTVADIIEDAQDSITFVRERLPAKLKSCRIDTENIAVSGSSAGGYLALLLALRDSKLRSSLAIYPISDPLETFFTTSQPTPGYKIDELAQYLDPESEVMSFNESPSPRDGMYYYMMDKAKLADLLHLQDCQAGESTKYRVAEEIKQAVEQGRKICPIFIVHGDADNLVGVNQAYIVRDALVAGKLDHLFLELPGADHSFDEDPKVTLEEMYGFMDKYWSK